MEPPSSLPEIRFEGVEAYSKTTIECIKLKSMEQTAKLTAPWISRWTNTVLLNVIRLTSGFIFRKYLESKTNNHIQNLIGAVAMSGVTPFVMDNPAPFILFGKKLVAAILRKSNDRINEAKRIEAG